MNFRWQPARKRKLQSYNHGELNSANNLNDFGSGFFPEKSPPSQHLDFGLMRPTAAAAAKSLQSCPTLCDPRDGSPPGSPVPGILQARTLEWVAISCSNAWKWKVKVKLLTGVQLLAIPWTVAYQAPPSMGVSQQEYWSGVPSPSPSPTAEEPTEPPQTSDLQSCRIIKWVSGVFCLLVCLWVWSRERFIKGPCKEMVAHSLEALSSLEGLYGCGLKALCLW